MILANLILLQKEHQNIVTQTITLIYSRIVVHSSETSSVAHHWLPLSSLNNEIMISESLKTKPIDSLLNQIRNHGNNITKLGYD